MTFLVNLESRFPRPSYRMNHTSESHDERRSGGARRSDWILRLGHGISLPGTTSSECAVTFVFMSMVLIKRKTSHRRQEQWYHALLLRSHPNPPANSKIHVPRPTFDKIFSSNDMQKLIDTLNEDSDSIPVRWLNAMLGRIFLGICGTAALEAVSAVVS